MKAAISATVAATCSASAAAVVRAELGAPAFLAKASNLFFGDDSDSSGKTHYGDTACPCIGFDRLSGETVVVFGDENATTNSSGAEAQVAYPADLGAHCEPWDLKRHPKCTGDSSTDPSWCGEPWCYVDPCRCKIETIPLQSVYVPDARYRGAPIHYSYATCGARNVFADSIPKVGKSTCRCIGLDNVPGSVSIKLTTPGKNGGAVSYPGDLGSTCSAWDRETHPMCKSAEPPKWCFQRWCYVDPCDCDLDEIPKVTMYLPKASFQAKSLYYSYETCGSKDFFTKEHNAEACTNQKSKDSCLDLKLKSGSNKCAWTGKACFGWELIEHPLCQHMAKRFDKSTATALRPFALSIVLVASSLFARVD
mmetsp:Transcript_115871/g.334629  ORF Transcript_115871/g.334629 Transcript_115871/m.334629 type:complete len:365 (-) Transcript_115871:86-1180(-)